MIEHAKNIRTAYEWQSTDPKSLYKPLTDCGNANYARDQWSETKAFMRKRKEEDLSNQRSAQKQKNIDYAVAQLEKKKRVLEDIMHLSPEKLSERLYQTKKNRWSEERMREDAPLMELFCFFCLSIGAIVSPIIFPIGAICYHFSDNTAEKRLKKALLFPDKIKAKHENLCLQIEKARQAC